MVLAQNTHLIHVVRQQHPNFRSQTVGQTERSDRFRQGRAHIGIGEKRLARIGVDGEEIGATLQMGATVIRHGGIIPPHSVKLMPGQYVKAYIRGNKNDGNDAEAICEAVSRPRMRLVAINTEAQQEIQMLHRIRSPVTPQDHLQRRPRGLTKA